MFDGDIPYDKEAFLEWLFSFPLVYRKIISRKLKCGDETARDVFLNIVLDLDRTGALDDGDKFEFMSKARNYVSTVCRRRAWETYSKDINSGPGEGWFEARAGEEVPAKISVGRDSLTGEVEAYWVGSGNAKADNILDANDRLDDDHHQSHILSSVTPFEDAEELESRLRFLTPSERSQLLDIVQLSKGGSTLSEVGAKFDLDKKQLYDRARYISSKMPDRRA